MRIVIIRHPNTQCRAIVCDQRITDKFVSDYSPIEDGRVENLHKDCSTFPLVERISIGKNEITFTITDGFQDSEKDWEGIEAYAIIRLHNYFGLDFNDFDMKSVEVQDRRAKFLKHSDSEFESENLRDYEVNITGLKRFVDNITISHDFQTHRASWRTALEKMCTLTTTFDGENEEHITKEDDALYWQHEIKAFDKAFDQLLALGLPQDA